MAKLFYFTATACNSNLQDVIHMCCMYVASINLFGLPLERMKCTECNLITCVDLLSLAI